MTTEPKFIPEDAVELTLDDNARMRVRMIDCVGYIIPSALGYIENEQPRMVHTPWFEQEVLSTWRQKSARGKSLQSTPPSGW